MDRRRLSRMIAFGVLMAVLALPASAWAAPARAHDPDGAWNRLASLWQRGISLLGSWSETVQKIQWGWDPNGSPQPSSSGTTGQGEDGHGFDPNGT